MSAKTLINGVWLTKKEIEALDLLKQHGLERWACRRKSVRVKGRIVGDLWTASRHEVPCVRVRTVTVNSLIRKGLARLVDYNPNFCLYKGWTAEVLTKVFREKMI